MHPTTTFVIDRSPEQLRKSRQNTIAFCVMEGIAASMFLGLAISTLVSSDYYWLAAVQFTPAALMLVTIATYLWTHHVLTTMRELRLLMTPEGVTYTSSAGTFSAPWSAVKSVRVGGRPGSSVFAPRHVIVHVPGWGGPVSRFLMLDRLTIHLTDTGVAADQIAAAVHHLSYGTRQVIGR